jgi:NAD(P)H-hydrate repair Nnr-like enzyme with NAD(P)H-hydrate epimerase domain
VIVDGIRGIGGAGAGLRDAARAAALGIRSLARRPFVVAVDVPSGIDADTGAADRAVIPADLTVTFGALKRGLTLEPARSLAGRIVVADIGLGLEG